MSTSSSARPPNFAPPLVAPGKFDLGGLLREGDWIVCGQAASEPLTLTRKLVAECPAGLAVTVFIGATFSVTFDGRTPERMRFASYGALGHAALLADRGLLDILPERYSLLADAFRRGVIPADVVLLQLAPGLDGGQPSLGLSNDYAIDAARRARVVIAEWNTAVPRTGGADLPDDIRIDHWVAAEQGPQQLPAREPPPLERAIAAHVAGVVPDGATLQSGIGSLPDAAFTHLGSHRRLGIHSGVLGDVAARLMRDGVVTNCGKGIDTGVSVTNTVAGTEALYEWVHANPAVAVRASTYTHDAAVLARLQKFHSINSALQVDLSGQVNCEAFGGRQRGGIGGLLDFSRAARASSDGGRAITVLPATADQGHQSRIVPGLQGNPVTLGRADVDLVITEFGVADLRNATLEQRARRLIAIAAPEFRETLERDWRASGQRSKP